jgi:hypothetical protein
MDGSCTDAFANVMVCPPLDDEDEELELEPDDELELLPGGGGGALPPPPPPQAAKARKTSAAIVRYPCVMRAACLSTDAPPMCKSLHCDSLLPVTWIFGVPAPQPGPHGGAAMRRARENTQPGDSPGIRPPGGASNRLLVDRAMARRGEFPRRDARGISSHNPPECRRGRAPATAI